WRALTSRHALYFEEREAAETIPFYKQRAAGTSLGQPGARLFLKNFIEKYFKVLSMDQRKGRKMKVWTHTIDLAERGGKSLCAFTSASSFVGEQLWE
ncbi:Protein of unknown function, partial [Gryllus bimaculatus]